MTNGKLQLNNTIDISTHTLTWSVTCIKILQRQNYINFNSHAHVERDETVQKSIHCLKNFNSHAHVERDFYASGLTNEQLNFNSHAHVERDGTYYTFSTNLAISTHTLTWSVTEVAENSYIHMEISTHTLTWSVTGILRQQRSNWKFQLTRSRGA